MSDDVIEGELLVPGTDVVVPEKSIWSPRGKAAEAMAGVLAGYDPEGILSTEAEEMFRAAVPESTRDAYVYQLLRWIVWSGETGRQHLPEPDEPMSSWMPRMVANIQEWITANYSMKNAAGKLRGRNGQPYAPDTVRLSLAAIAKLYRRRGLPSPTHHENVKDQMRSYARQWTRAKNKHDIAASITWDELVKMVRVLDLNTVAGLRDAFLLRLAAECGRRNSELMAMNWQDLRFTSATQLVVEIPLSKTNQDGDKPDRAMVQADLDLEPDIDTLLLGREWREVCAAAGMAGGKDPVFPKVRGSGQKRKDGLRSGVLLPVRMDRKNYQDVVLMAAKKSGVIFDPETGDVRKVVPHSLRVYMATNAARVGIPLGIICDQGGWSRKSPVVLRYQRDAQRWDDNNPGVMIRARKKAELEAERARQEAERGS